MRVIVLLLVLGLALTANAQRDTVTISVQFPSFEYNQADITQFNAFLETTGLPTGKMWPWSFHFNGMISYKNFRATATVGGGPNKNLASGDTTYTQSSLILGLDIGYDISLSEHFRFYPFAGYRSTGLDYRFEIDTLHTLASYFQTPSTNKKLNYSRNNVVLGLGIEYGYQIYIGLKSGIYLPIDQGRWRANNSNITGSTPVLTFNYFAGFYVGLPIPR